MDGSIQQGRMMTSTMPTAAPSGSFNTTQYKTAMQGYGIDPNSSAAQSWMSALGSGQANDQDFLKAMSSASGGNLASYAPPATPAGSPTAPAAAPAAPMQPADGINRGTQQAFPSGPDVQTAGLDLNSPDLTPVNTDFSGAENRAGTAAYQSATQYFDPDFARARSGLQTELINQGFAPGSQGYNDQMSLLQRGQDQARTGAALNAVGVGNQEAGNLFLRALQARQQQVGERGSEADREFGQSLGIANLGLGARGQDIGLQGSMAGLAASRENAGASRYNADLQHQIQLQQLGLQANGQNFDQVMSLLGGARSGVNMPNFGNPQPLDVTGAGSLANQGTMIGNQATAARNAGLYGLGAAALGGLGSYFGGSGP